jgi:AcrR family transcriptional regulator
MSAPAPSVRDRLVDAAVACFTEHGVAETSLETVAAAAGVHRVTLHRAFPGGRAELIIEVLNRTAEVVAQQALAAVAEAPTAAAGATAAATHLVMRARQEPILLQALASPEAQEAMVTAAGAPLQRIMADVWAVIVRRAATTGEWIRDDLDPAALSGHWTRVLLSLATNPSGVATPTEVQVYLDTFVVAAVIRPAR